MRLADFNYSFPEELIAQKPLKRRDQARLLVVDRNTKSFSHDKFVNLGAHLPRNSLLVFNDTKVVPARLLGKKERSGGRVEVFLLNKRNDGAYDTLLRPLKKIKTGDRLRFNKNGLTAEIVDRENMVVRFSRKNLDVVLDKIGHMPLPPYIKRNDTQSDRRDYQTVFAKKKGSVAAPTAGLHFTDSLMRKLKKKGHDIKYVTLHVNYATFKPVEESDIRKHKMHEEFYSVSRATFKALEKAKREKRPVVAVGTTSCRVLETVARTGQLTGKTDLFIYPGFSFQAVDALITNFHQPHSTLLMLVYAFGGTELMKRAYREAIKEEYRFFSYGDGMIIK